MQSWGDQLISADNYAHQNIKPVNGYICFFTAASRIDYLFLVPHLAKYQKGRSFYRSHIKKNKCFGLYFERGICVIHLLLTSIKLILSSAVKTFCFHDFKPFLFVWKINGIKFCHAFRTVSSLKKKKKSYHSVYCSLSSRHLFAELPTHFLFLGLRNVWKPGRITGNTGKIKMTQIAYLQLPSFRFLFLQSHCIAEWINLY